LAPTTPFWLGEAPAYQFGGREAYLMLEEFGPLLYVAIWHPSKRQHAAQARLLLELERTTPPAIADQSPAIATEPRRCPCCGRGHLVYIRRLTPKNALGP